MLNKFLDLFPLINDTIHVYNVLVNNFQNTYLELYIHVEASSLYLLMYKHYTLSQYSTMKRELQ